MGATFSHIVEETRRELAVFAAEMMGAQAYLGQFAQHGRPIQLSRAERRRLLQLIDASGDPYMVIDPRPGLRILDVNDAYAAQTLTQRSRIAGDRLFDVFPDNPDMPGADGVSNLFESLQRATQTGQRHVMVRQRYDVRDARGGFVERHWLPTNTPVFDERGSLLYVLHHAVQVPPV